MGIGVGARLAGFAVAAVLAVGGILPGPVAGQAGPVGEAAEQTVIFLVRHAETAPDGTRDPPLSAEGRDRAGRLAAVLRDVGLRAVFTTDYRRTRGTAGLPAAGAGLEPAYYDPSGLDAFAAELRVRTGPILVVGHSNTTPALVEALGGVPGTPIDESEHDRLYVVIINGESVQTALLRY